MCYLKEENIANVTSYSQKTVHVKYKNFQCFQRMEYCLGNGLEKF